MSLLPQSIRIAARSLTRTPVVTGVAVLTLALTVGAVTAVFSLLDQVFLRPLPYASPDRLVVVAGLDETNPTTSIKIAPELFSRLRASTTSFEDLAAYVAEEDTIYTLDEHEHVRGAVVTANLFDLLGVQPLLGRGFLSADGEQSPEQAVVLGYELWRRAYGADPDVLGTPVRLNGLSYRVVGVMEAGFDFPDDAEIWLPNPHQAHQTQNIDFLVYQYLSVIGRLRPGVSREQAAEETSALVAGETGEDISTTLAGTRVVSLHERLMGDLQPAVLTAFAAVALVLLIACLNIANLLLVRAAGRHREISVRAALGAGRRRLAAQLLGESLLLSLVGGALGVLAAYLFLGALMRLAPPALVRLSDVSLDPRVLAFTLALSLASGLFFGLAPALYGLRLDLSTALNGSRAFVRSSAGGGGRWNAALVVTEVSLAVMLLVGALLMLQSFLTLTQTEIGFEPDNAAYARLVASRDRFPSSLAQEQLFAYVLEQAGTRPEIETVGGTKLFYLTDGTQYSTLWPLEPDRPGQRGPGRTVKPAFVTPGYFEALGTPLLRGRLFTRHDSQDSGRVAIITEALAGRLWGNVNPLGRQVYFEQQTWTVGGVVATARQVDPEGWREPEIYLPIAQAHNRWPFMTIVVRGRTSDTEALAALRDVVGEMGGEDSVIESGTLTQLVNAGVADERFAATVLSSFALVALLLSGLGIYGVVASSVRGQTREIGVRMALGSSRGTIFLQKFRLGLTLGGTGLVVGLAAAFGFTRTLDSLLHGVEPLDPDAFLLSSGLILALLCFAIFLPARRAASLDPVEALRHEG